MIKKRKLLFSIIGLCLFLTACGTSTNNSDKSTTKTTVHNTKKQDKTASQTKKTDTNKSQKSNDQNATTQKSQSGSINLSQISNDDFSSLVGTWKNNDNKTIKITGNTLNAPEDSNFYKKVGTEIAGLPEIDGQPAVITSGKITNNYIQGSIGHFISTGDSMDPLTIIPKGVKVSSNDDSDSNQDRLIEGGGQSGYANSAYYRQGN